MRTSQDLTGMQCCATILRYWGIAALASMGSFCNHAWSQSSARTFLKAEHPLARAVVLVAQDASGAPGNGVVVGVQGCHVLTNFHVAFGRFKDPHSGRIDFVERIAVGHRVLVNAHFDSGEVRFAKALTGIVIAYGNFEQDTRRGKAEDYAVLELEPCLGPGFGLTSFERDAENRRYPEGRISTVAFTEMDGRPGIVMELRCPDFEGAAGNPAAQAPVTGMTVTRCTLPPGTSGSMLLATDEAGVFRLVGINQGGDYAADGQKVSVSVYARKYSAVLARVLGQDASPSQKPR